MAFSSQQPIIFRAYDPFAPKTKHKTVAEYRGTDEVGRLSGEPEQWQTCIQEPLLYLSHRTEISDSNLDQNRLLHDFPSTLHDQPGTAVLERPSDTAPGPQDNRLDIDAGIAADGREREGLINVADTRIIVEGSVEAISEPLLEEPDAVYSSAVRTDSLRLRKRTRSHSADTSNRVVRPPCLSPRWISGRTQPGKRRKLVKSFEEAAKLTSPSKSVAPSRSSNARQIFSRDEDGPGDIDYDSSESSDLESRPDHNVKGKPIPGIPTVLHPKVHRRSTSRNSETENSVNEDEGADSEVDESSGASSTLSYNQCNMILSAGPQRCHHASVDTVCPPRRYRSKKDWNTAPKRKRLNSATVQSRATRISTQASQGSGRQRRASPATTRSTRSSDCDRQPSNSLFEIRGLSSHFQPNSDTVVAHLRALNPQSLTMASIPGLEAFGAEFQTVHWVQRTQESWLLIGFRDRTTASISRTGRTRRSSALEPESNTSRDITGLEPGSTEESSEEDNDPAVGEVRASSSRGRWKRSDEYRLLSYRDKEKMAWTEIYKRFPSRSEGAVKTRYYILREAKTHY